ncbi:hypothetical protein ACH5A7_34900 [Streptomyces sp. NPDC018955]|uniref:hypothetical protein n=1 Tax=Streptomyces sp. NPDC018955 TaxID=3365055 RepID=UPI0037B4A1E4
MEADNRQAPHEHRKPAVTRGAGSPASDWMRSLMSHLPRERPRRSTGDSAAAAAALHDAYIAKINTVVGLGHDVLVSELSREYEIERAKFRFSGGPAGHSAAVRM